MADQQRLGLFKEPSYITVGDPYEKRIDTDPRHAGKQLITSPQKLGQTGDNWNDKKRDFKPLYVGEPFLESGQLDAKDRAEAKTYPKPFVPSSPPKRSAGLSHSSDYFGTFGPKYEHLPDYPATGIPAQRSGPSPRHILTNPPKKGNAGFPNITIGALPKYEFDPYDNARHLEKAEKEKAKERQKTVSGAIFKGMSHPLDFFDTQSHVAASKVFSRDSPLPPPKSDPPDHAKPAVPFKPSSPNKSGFNGAFDRFPQYIEDPLELKHQKEMEESKRLRSAGVFKPTSWPKSVRTPSVEIVNARLGR